MNVESEIQAIKVRLEQIESYLSSNQKSGVSQSDKNPSFEILDLEVKRTQSNLGPDYAYKLTVQNNSENKAQLSGWIIFLDQEDFEVTKAPIGNFSVAAHSKFTKTGKTTILDSNHAPRIVDVTAELFSI